MLFVELIILARDQALYISKIETKQDLLLFFVDHPQRVRLNT